MARTLTYVTTDSLAEGIGTSQVLRYVERLADRGYDVRLHSFEKTPPPGDVRDGLAARGVRWTPHPFGRLGPIGGLGRVARAAWALRGARLVHARSDLAAAAALLAGRRRWIWDVRSLWSDELVHLGRMRRGGVEERVMRAVERASARRSAGVVTLAAAAIPVLAQRHGADVAAKARVVPTCVDLDRFTPVALPDGDVQVLLSGTVNGCYDGPAMVRLVELLRARTPTRFTVLGSTGSPWDAELDAVADERARVAPADVPAWLGRCHVGLSMWTPDVGIALTAAMPTKIGELLATGRPVVVNAGLGDMDQLIAEHRCGVVVAGTGDDALAIAADELLALLADPETPARCRRAAEAHFDLDRGVDRLVELYEVAASSR